MKSPANGDLTIAESIKSFYKYNFPGYVEKKVVLYTYYNPASEIKYAKIEKTYKQSKTAVLIKTSSRVTMRTFKSICNRFERKDKFLRVSITHKLNGKS